MSATNETINNIKKAVCTWWSNEWGAKEFVVPTYGGLDNAKDALFATGYEPTYRLKYKKFATGALAEYADKVEAGLELDENANTATLGFKAFQGRHTFLTGSLTTQCRGDYCSTSTSVSMSGSYLYPLSAKTNGTLTSAVLRAEVNNVRLDKNQVASESCDVSAALDIRHDNGTVGIRLCQSCDGCNGQIKPNFQVSATLGKAGLSTGVELEANSEGKIVDYNAAIQYQRKNAITTTIATKNSTKDFEFSSLFHLGSKHELAVAYTTEGKTDAPLACPLRWTGGLQYKLKPTGILGPSTIKAMYSEKIVGTKGGHVKRAGSEISSEAGVSFSTVVPEHKVAFSLNAAMPLQKNAAAKIGVSLALGDNYDEPEMPLPGARAAGLSFGSCCN